MPRGAPEPPEPSPQESAAYNDLMERVLAAASEQELLALIQPILAFTGYRVRLDFGEAWTAKWRQLAGDKPAPPLWPTLL